MKYTPFTKSDCVEYFQNEGVFIVNDPKEADVLVTRKYPLSMRQYVAAIKSGVRKILVWTHEPRFATKEISQQKLFPGIDVYFMTMYTHDVYLNNYAPYYGFRKLPYNEVSADHWSDRSHSMVALARYLKPYTLFPFKKDGRNIDLRKQRQEMILKGKSCGFVDVYGRGWPGNIVEDEEDIPGKDWVERKINILKNYKFNLALENTNWPNYVSEKLWNSIESGCLPVYYGDHNNIYKDFPKGSFVDYVHFNSHQDLFEYLQNMSEDEFTERLNLCFDTYKSVYQRIAQDRPRMHEVLDRIIDKLNQSLA